MPITRRKFLSRVLLGAAAAVPVLLIGRGARSTNVWGTDQDRIFVDFDYLTKNFDTPRAVELRIRFIKHPLAGTVGSMRLENVKLALNKRFLMRRGRQVDLRGLNDA